jgi:putative cardiolipin synthase
MIPVPGFMENLDRLADEGVDVTILTGSMESNNHTVAHSHYKKYRKPILEAGVRLKEYRGWPAGDQLDIVNVAPVESEFVALHVKTLVGDRQRCFIGSLNLDPRAMAINTENGLLIESRGLAEELGGQIDAMSSSENAWSVTRDPGGRLRWTSSTGTQSVQPARGFGQRIADFFYQFLPIESQL